MATTIEVSAPGKINLYFAVGAVQPNGYHPVASLYSAVSLREKVVLSESATAGVSLSVSLAGDSPLAAMAVAGAFDIAEVPLDERNLAYKAAVAVLQAHGLSAADISINLHLEKAVPVAGGMGGGSADAAAALVAVNRYVKARNLVSAELSTEELLKIAAPLGADVPFALQGGMAVGMGVGDQLSAVQIPAEAEPLHLVMVPASYGLSTPAVFAELDRGRAAGQYPPPTELSVPQDLLDALQSCVAPMARLHEIEHYVRNDLAAPACSLASDLKKTLGVQDEAIVGSCVSGSGPTVALLTDSQDSAERIAAALRRRDRFAVAVQAPDAGAQ